MIARLVMSWSLVTVGLAGILLISAGTIDWPAAWAFLAELTVLNLGLGLWLARHDPGLLAERLGSPFQRGQNTWDKVFLVVVMVLYVAWITLIGLDRRWAISHMPVYLQWLGALGVALSTYVIFLTFRENSYAAPVVKIQRERGHRVVSSGPYAWVRHPMYAGGLVMFLCIPLQLGSWLGLGAALLFVAALAIRIPMEERTLRAGLEGYDAYAGRVRWRLIPGIW
jgi:protein-S-isoprenylcysteine O-methyltransferase Ste14